MKKVANKSVLLVNPNRMRPPIAPLGLECLAQILEGEGYTPILLDLSWAGDWEFEVDAALAEHVYAAIAVSVRNLDDAYFASQDFILEKTADIIARIKVGADAPVILGGVGYSIAPDEILKFTGADYGVQGSDEEALPDLLQALETGTLTSLEGRILLCGPRAEGEDALPRVSRRWLDHSRYFAEGGQAGIETKRGCGQSCLYCVEPHAKGRRVRCKAPKDVVAEARDLVAQGVHVFHLCDSEFNLPTDHALAVCEALSESGLAEEIQWYAYGYPAPFDAELAQAMVKAGCLGMNFGVDHTDTAMLRRLGRNYTLDDIRRTVEHCREAGMTVMCDMLLGGPGETGETLASVIEDMKSTEADRIGLSCGVRIYPNTPLAALVRSQGALHKNPNLQGAVEDNASLLKPIFYIDAGVGEGLHDKVSALVDGDARFLHANPNEIAGNYNYNDNSVLAQAIRDGARGAYWDILRQLDEEAD